MGSQGLVGPFRREERSDPTHQLVDGMNSVGTIPSVGTLPTHTRVDNVAYDIEATIVSTLTALRSRLSAGEVENARILADAVQSLTAARANLDAIDA